MRKEFLIHFIFQVYYSTNPQLPLSRWESQFVDNNKLTTISDLTPHTIYTIRVEAYTSIGPGPLSTPVQVYSTVQCTGLQYGTVYNFSVVLIILLDRKKTRNILIEKFLSSVIGRHIYQYNAADSTSLLSNQFTDTQNLDTNGETVY